MPILLIAALHGINTKTSEFFLANFGPLGGGWGAKRSEDGVSATVCINDGDTHNGPSEQSEVKFPIVVERYALVPDSGGAGRHRGGLGVERVVRARVPMTFNTQVERAHCKPWGLDGGGDATGNEVALRIDGRWKTDFPNAKVLVAMLKTGDAFRLRSGGGGGYGSPLDRPAADVAADAKQGYISLAAAREPLRRRARWADFRRRTLPPPRSCGRRCVPGPHCGVKRSFSIGADIAGPWRSGPLLEPLILHRHISVRSSGGVPRGRGCRKGPTKSLDKDFAAMSRVSSLSSPFLLGFDEIERVLDRVGKAADGYPPYNIERVPRDGNSPERLRITLAVAGFTRDQLDVTVEESQLVIRGRQQDDKSRQYIHRGIAARQFQRTFVLADGMEVLGADLKNGLLSIDLVRPQPERTVKSISIKECD